MEISSRKVNQTFTAGDSFSVSYKLRQREGSTGKSITLSFSYDYMDNNTGNWSSGGQSISVNLPLPDPSTMNRPNITIAGISTAPEKPGRAEAFTASFTLNNLSDTEARNINVELRGQDNFRILDFTNRQFISELIRGKVNTVLFRLQAVEDRRGNDVQLVLSYTYSGKTDPVEQVITAYIPLGEIGSEEAPLLKVESFSFKPVAGRDEQLLRVVLHNLGKSQARDISLSFEGSDIFFLGRSNVDHIAALESGKSVENEYLVGINQTAGKAYYPLSVGLSYKDSRGNEYETKETIGIPAGELGVSLHKGEPRVLISKYTLSEEKILAGNVVTLKLNIENTHTRPVRNIKVSLGVYQVEGGSTGSGTAATGGTVFSPINSSNSFFIDRIPARTTLEQSVDLLVDPNATAKTYIIPVIIEYEDEDAKSYEVREMVNIPVTQESRLQVLSVEVPPVAFMGQPLFVSAEFVNVGKVDLGNFIVMLEGDFHKEQAAYFVGNLQIGQSNYYQGIIHPDKEGTLQGKLIFSYLDNNNREVRLAEPFSIEVQAGGEMGGPFNGDIPPHLREPYKEPPGGGGKKFIYYIGGAALLLAAAVVIILRRRAARKAGEELLDA